MQNLIVGCGLTGSVIARHLAEKGEKVTIWDRRNHIGGNMYDYTDENGISIHKYGPHVFHTYDKELRDYMLKYSNWQDFFITCQVDMQKKVTPSPFNYKTIDDYYDAEHAEKLKKALEKEYSGREKATIVELLESDVEIIKQYADFLFECDYSLYTAKQWGVSPSEIDPSVLKRVPVLFSYKEGYFDDTYQMLPEKGYEQWFKNILNHPNITVELGVEALDRITIKDNKVYLDANEFNGKLVYTGAIDELLGLKYGPLAYRSVNFELKTVNKPYFQTDAIVAYPEAEGFTRITEYKYFLQKSDRDITTIAYEYPIPYHQGTSSEPYYPVLTDETQEVYKKYLSELDGVENLILCGRLADFKYYNMDQALKRALDVCSKL